MGRKSAKGKEKKQKRKEENARIAVKMAIVDAANAQEDPMATMKPFKTFDRNGVCVSISCHKMSQLDKETADWAFSLTKTNMQKLYEESEWGWSDKQKKDEMTEDKAWYIIARDLLNESRPIGFVHFRFDLDNDDEVLYCYEIQLNEDARRKGLGKFLMQILELLAFKTQMKKVVLTVFKNNHEAQEFFKKTLKYDLDESSPEKSLVTTMMRDEEETYSYEILSKRIGIKPKEVISSVTHNGFSVCSGHCCHH